MTRPNDDGIKPRTYREYLAEKIFVATIQDASEDIKDEADYPGFAAFWGKRCLLMADGFIDAVKTEREG